jgi:hypothetical protein
MLWVEGVGLCCRYPRITAKALEPAIDLRKFGVFNRTLFSRDDQVL